jgi:hypothetical protein
MYVVKVVALTSHKVSKVFLMTFNGLESKTLDPSNVVTIHNNIVYVNCKHGPTKYVMTTFVSKIFQKVMNYPLWNSNEYFF